MKKIRNVVIFLFALLFTFIVFPKRFFQLTQKKVSLYIPENQGKLYRKTLMHLRTEPGKQIMAMWHFLKILHQLLAPSKPIKPAPHKLMP